MDGCLDPQHPDALCHVVTTGGSAAGLSFSASPEAAGKTALLLRLTLQLLRNRDTDSRQVPVLLRLSTWNSDIETPTQWITKRLEIDYGFRRPIPTKRLQLLLDGLDEMPAEKRILALRMISDELRPGSTLVLTSRTDGICRHRGRAT